MPYITQVEFEETQHGLESVRKWYLQIGNETEVIDKTKLLKTLRIFTRTYKITINKSLPRLIENNKVMKGI